MQFNLDRQQRDAGSPVHLGHDDAAVYLAVSILMHTCTGSFRLNDLSIEAIWNYIRKSIVQPLFFLICCCFSASLPLTPDFFSLFSLLSQCDGCLDVPVWRLMAQGFWDC